MDGWKVTTLGLLGGFAGLEPGVAGQLVEGEPVAGVHRQAALDHLLQALGEGRALGPVREALQDLLVLLEGDVADDEVVEQDAEAPDGEAARRVPTTQDPLGGRVHAGTCRGAVSFTW